MRAARFGPRGESHPAGGAVRPTGYPFGEGTTVTAGTTGAPPARTGMRLLEASHTAGERAGIIYGLDETYSLSRLRGLTASERTDAVKGA